MNKYIESLKKIKDIDKDDVLDVLGVGCHHNTGKYVFAALGGLLLGAAVGVGVTWWCKRRKPCCCQGCAYPSCSDECCESCSCHDDSYEFEEWKHTDDETEEKQENESK